MKFQLRTAFVAVAILGNVDMIMGHSRHGPAIVRRSDQPASKWRYESGGEYHHSESSHAEVTRRHIESRGAKTVEDVVKAWVDKEAPGSTYEIDSKYLDADTGVTHVYITQTVGGLPVENGRGNIHVKKDLTFFSGSIFFTTQTKARRAKRTTQLTPLQALSGALDVLGIKTEGQFEKAGIVPITGTLPLSAGDAKYSLEGIAGTKEPPSLKPAYLAGEDGLQSVYVVDYRDENYNWMHMVVDTVEEKKIWLLADYVKDASYNVYKLGINDPREGNRTTLVDPFKKEESPYGWHTTKTKKFTTLRGNNGYSILNGEADERIDFLKAYSPEGKAELKFDFPFDQNEKNVSKIADAAAIQVFYLSNIYHDLLEQLGFTEAAGNFEENPTAGLGGDAPVLHIHYGYDTGLDKFRNNANFGTPPDGQRPTMRMFLWDAPVAGGPELDSSFDNGVIIHEYTHGLSTRLTGGPANSQCLDAFEAAGMGEGWGDFFATAIRLKKTDTRKTNYGMGGYLVGNTQGIREYLYSTDVKTNPLSYENVNEPDRIENPHAVGTVWASILYEVLWNLVDDYGITEEIFPTFVKGTKTPADGRNLAMKLVLEGMKLQPCNPTFIGARNAIIDADILFKGGANWCRLWTAFAKRGLGYDVQRTKDKDGVAVRVNGFKLPPDCKA
ncbi:extracellular metallo proteinase 2 [Peziza echinospora]|nr:extracellular metallo proteinase 2 [Peziza echinospora]